MSAANSIKYVGIGNPLLDILVHVDKSLLEKFKLDEGSAILAAPEHIPLFPIVQGLSDVRYCAGGSSMNTARALSWLFGAPVPHVVAFVGCTGTDGPAATLRKAIADAGVEPLLLETDKRASGQCAALITGKERTLVTHLGAAELYDVHHLQTDPRVQEALASARVYYSEGFFTTVSVPSLIELGKRAITEDKRFLFNVSASFLPTCFWDDMSRVIEYVDGLFCNETEAAAVARRNGWPEPENLDDVALRMCALPQAEGKKRKRTVVITNGAGDTTVCGPETDGKVRKFPVIKIAKEDVVDTNGAGDCFVAGFIWGILNDKDLQGCIDAANYAAWRVIQCPGCAFSGPSDYVPGTHYGL